MRPSDRMLYVATGWCLLGVVVANWSAFLPVWLGIGALVFLTAAADTITLPRSRRIKMHRELPGRFALGVAAEVKLHIQHDLGRSLKVLLVDGIPAEAEAPSLPWKGALPAEHVFSLAYDLRFTRRGRHTLGAVEMLADSALGLWRRRLFVGENGETHCYPNYEPVVRFALLATSHREEQMGIVKKRRSGANLEFHQLREYQDGDVLSRIDWRATSRRNELISRDYEEQRNQTMLLVPDCGRRMRSMDGDATQFDHCLNSMLLLSYIALRQGDEIGVLNFGGEDRWLKPVKGVAAMPKVLNHLYDYETTTEPSDFSEAAQRIMSRQKRRALVVFLTNLRTEDSGHLVKAMQVLRQRHLVMVATLRESELEQSITHPVASEADALGYGSLCTYLADRERLMRSLRSRGILTLDETAEGLPIALANSYLDLKNSGAL